VGYSIYGKFSDFEGLGHPCWWILLVESDGKRFGDFFIDVDAFEDEGIM
jgi:hypothetical protein